jgi:anti-sigma B factor antagonist
MGLEITTLREGDRVVITLCGELDIYTAAEFSRYWDLVPAGSPDIVIDLTQVDLVDSSGLGALLRISPRPKLRCQRSLTRLLRVTGLTDQFQIEPSSTTDARAAH